MTTDSGSPRKSVTFARNPRSRCPGIVGHVRPESAVTLPRNTQDELEKGISTGVGDQDGGVSRRILGTFLTWLSERNSAQRPVFIVATANDISALPPELVRKGRFDEIFFVDFPNALAQEQIFSIHLKKRKLDPGGFDLPACAARSDAYSGAEIEQSIIAALFEARSRNAVVNTAEVLQELARTRPLSVVMAERIGVLREWAHDRAVMADDGDAANRG